MQISDRNMGDSLNVIPTSAILVDIETTGLSPTQHQLYGMGICYVKDGVLCCQQGFIEHSEEEKSLLTAFLPLLKASKHIYVYNGTQFDLPFLQRRYEYYGILSNPFWEDKRVVELKKLPFFKWIAQNKVNRAAVEKLLGYKRTISAQGKELAKIIKLSLSNTNPVYCEVIKTHNAEELQSIHYLLQVQLFIQALPLTQFERYEETENAIALVGKLSEEIVTISGFHITTPYYLFEYSREEKTITLTFTRYQLTLRKYLSPLKAYYFIPDKQQVLHESIAQYIPKEQRRKAKKEECYVSQEALYIRQPDQVLPELAVWLDEVNNAYIAYKDIDYRQLWDVTIKSIATYKCK